MNGGRYFLDTNVLVYTFDDVARDKWQIATDLVDDARRTHRGVISFQVIQEFFSVATRNFVRPLTTLELQEYLRTVLAPLCAVHSSLDLYQTCLNIREQTGYSVYDSLIVAAAAAAGCKTLYSEDLQDGQIVAGVKIVNPF
jgi:predicted nucleic acid-binding protein